MKVVWSWLREFVEVEGDVEDVATRLTMAGLEVEELVREVVAGEGCRVVRVEAVAPHPDADHLTIATLEPGDGTPKVHVVCGAPNCEATALAVYAPAGTTLAGGREVREVEIRGVRSAGMLVSERELGISDEHDGILLLDEAREDAKAGRPFADLLELEEWVLTLGLTPNRPDWMSHAGIAREIGALTGATFRAPRPDAVMARDGVADDVAIVLSDPEGCPRYVGYVLEGVTLGPAPLRMRRRLALTGVRSISNVVDVTNYVNLELGHPQHAFDLDKMAGAEIRVRRAKEGEKLRTLDDVERTLVTDDLVIADAREAVALAGVMGGGDTEVTGETRRVLLETATFDPIRIRRTSKRLGLRTESSMRFERGVDRAGVGRAADRTAELLAQVAGARVVAARDAYPLERTPRRLSLRVKRCNAVLGTALTGERMGEHLKALGCEVSPESWMPETMARADALAVEVPTFRPDLEREIDLIEEVARLEGFGAIEEAPERPTLSARAPTELIAPVEELAAVRAALVGLGFHEAINYGFTSEKVLSTVHPLTDAGAGPLVRIQNPLSVDQSVMRNTLLPQLLGNVRENLKHAPGAWLFEVGRTFRPRRAGAGGDGLPREALTVCLVAAGLRSHAGLDDAPASVLEVKGAVLAALEAVGLRAGWREAQRWRFVRCAAFELVSDAAADVLPPPALESRDAELTGPVARFGAISPDVLLRWDIETPTFMGEIHLARVVTLARAGAGRGVFRPFSRFPGSRRDVAFVVAESTASSDVLDAMRPEAEPLLVDVQLFDEYRGEGIVSGKKSLAYRLHYAALDRTVTKEEVDRAHGVLVSNVCEALGVQIR